MASQKFRRKIDFAAQKLIALWRKRKVLVILELIAMLNCWRWLIKSEQRIVWYSTIFCIDAYKKVSKGRVYNGGVVRSSLEMGWDNRRWGKGLGCIANPIERGMLILTVSPKFLGSCNSIFNHKKKIHAHRMVVFSVAAVFLFLCSFLVWEDRRFLFFPCFLCLPSTISIVLRHRCLALLLGDVRVWSRYERWCVVLVSDGI